MTPVRSSCVELVLSLNENDWKIFKNKGVFIKCLIIASFKSLETSVLVCKSTSSTKYYNIFFSLKRYLKLISTNLWCTRKMSIIYMRIIISSIIIINITRCASDLTTFFGCGWRDSIIHYIIIIVLISKNIILCCFVFFY
jgi:hypothetical protein